MSRQRLLLQGVAGVVLAGAGVALYLSWIPVHRPQPARIAALASTAPVSGLRQPQPHVTDPRSSALGAVRAAAASSPGETGSYSVGWKGSGKVTSGLVSLDVLPTRQSARAAFGDAQRVHLSPTSLTSLRYGLGGSTRVPGIPGAKGAYYLKGTNPQITPTTGRATVIAFRLDRVVEVVTVEATGRAATTTARALASAQYRHLRRVGSDPTIGTTDLPVVASALFVLGTLAVIVLAELVPGMVSADRRRREAAREAALRSSRGSRGSKIVKRRAARGYATRR